MSGKTGMTFMYGTNSFKRKSTLRGFTNSDLITCQQIALLGTSRLDIFSNILATEKKKSMTGNIITFVKKFMNFTNYKEVVGAVKNQLP